MASANEPGNRADDSVTGAAFTTACDKLGFDPRFAPARLDDERSEDGIADLAANLHAERKALLEAEDKLTDEREYAVLAPLLATFRSNCIPQRDIRSVIEQMLMITRLRCAFRHAPGVTSPDCLRQRARSLALREAGSRWTEIYETALASKAFRVSILERLRELAEWSERLRETVAEKRRMRGEEARRRADARS